MRACGQSVPAPHPLLGCGGAVREDNHEGAGAEPMLDVQQAARLYRRQVVRHSTEHRPEGPSDKKEKPVITSDPKVGATSRKPARVKAKANEPDPNGLRLIGREGVSVEQVKAEMVFHPIPRHAATGAIFAAQVFGGTSTSTINDGVAVLSEACAATRAGDLGLQRDMLTAQAMTLDGLFTELARRAAMNMGEYLDATDRFLRLALKAQAQSRATVEALDQLVRGGEQVVRHIHVDNRGGQAIVAETVNTGDRENSENDEQSRTTGNFGVGSALLSPDAFGHGVPISGCSRQAALQDARRHELGSAERQL